MIDSHVHLDDPRFKKDRDQIIQNFDRDGLELVVNIGADLESSRASVDLARKYDKVYAAVGIHPHDASSYSPEVEKELIDLAQDEKVLAIGEIGLDYYYDNSPRDIQKEVFEKQLDLAHRLGLPIVIHTREASKDTFDRIKAHMEKQPQDKVLIHCFSESLEMMREYVKLGCYIALGGAVTFKNARVPKEVALEVPLDRLLLETDCPYLTPEPLRGKRNEPAYVRYVGDFIANLRKINLDDLLDQTARNTKAFYGIQA
ncbi:hydrolase TatD [Tissierellia bacterium S5-A11]|nr:hydrolase TatD [Tissierellia bacterium S5-A11]